MNASRLTASAIARRKGRGAFAAVTAYDAPSAAWVEAAAIDVILVGDSVGDNVLGFASTRPVSIAHMIHHGAAVVRATQRAHVIIDLPFGSYQASQADAVRSATLVIRKTDACSVKLEGGEDAADRIAAIVRSGIPVMAHIGLLPQTASLGTGMRIRGDRERLLADAEAVADAGAYAVVLEAVDANIAAEITERVHIPTVGIGSGAKCDAQILVLHDVLGLNERAPSFAKRYADVRNTAISALRSYKEEVAAGKFPLRSDEPLP